MSEGTKLIAQNKRKIKSNTIKVLNLVNIATLFIHIAILFNHRAILFNHRIILFNHNVILNEVKNLKDISSRSLTQQDTIGLPQIVKFVGIRKSECENICASLVF